MNLSNTPVFYAVVIGLTAILMGVAFLRMGSKKKKAIDLGIKFHRDANLYGEHGVLIASNRKLGLTNYPVRFVFPGISTPPELSLELFSYIWNEALDQGFIPHALGSYGRTNEGVHQNRTLEQPTEEQQIAAPAGALV